MIDEKKLIEAIVNTPSDCQDDCCLEFLEGMATRQHEILDIINEQPKTDWIPCEVELPKEMKEVLISRENSKTGTSIGYYNKVFGWYDQCLLRGVTDVVAWMPKPMEYKKEGAE